MRKVALQVCLVTILVLFIFSLTQEAQAIPTFARKYRTSCTTCHVGFNKLNPFGEAYRYNGYQIPQGEEVAYVKEEPVSLGAPAWKKVWPEAVWPGEIPQNVPLAFMIHQRMNIQKNDATATVDFNMPHEFELMLGGTLGDFASFLGLFVLDEDGNVGGLEEMYIQFNDLLYGGAVNWLPKFSQDALNLKAGRFHVAAEPFHDPTRRTLSHLRMYDYTVSSGTWNLRDIQSGLEVNGILKSRLRYAAGIVNGNGLVQDNNDEKDGYFRLAYKFGGMAFDGSGEEFGAELKQSDNWVDNSLTLGTFGYWGTAPISTWDNDFYRVGGDLRINRGDLDLYGAVVFGEDEKPNANDQLLKDVDSTAWFVGADYVFYPWLIGHCRFEQDKVDLANRDDVEDVILSFSAYPRANLRLTLEGTYFPDDKEDGNHLLRADLAYVF